MFAHHSRTAVRQMFALAIPLVVATWLVSVPTLTGAPRVFALLALLTAFGWVVRTTYRGALPASSPVRSLAVADRADSPTRQWRHR